MTLEECRSLFDSKMNGENIIITDNVTVNINSFFNLFKDINKLTYEEFIEKDNGKMGYKDFFDRCKQEGILN